MRRLGIDVGSTYTKYCLLSEQGQIEALWCEKTPVRQKEYFAGRLSALRQEKGEFLCASCGYGKANTAVAARSMNELSALAAGANFVCPQQHTVLDIGGQDTKLIRQENGRLKEFFLNDRCAAGSGMFLKNTLNLLEMDFADIDLQSPSFDLHLSSACAVFAQTEIVELVAANVPAQEILRAVLCHILLQAKSLLGKVDTGGRLLLSGGLTEIAGLDSLAGDLLGVECMMGPHGRYLSALGCALNASP